MSEISKPSKPKRLMRYAWVAIPMSVFVIDFVVRWGEHWLMWWMYDVEAIILSVMGSALMWWSITLLLAGARGRRVVAPIIGFSAAFLLGAGWRFKIVRFFDVSADLLAYFWREPINGLSLASTGVSVAFVGAVLLLGAFWTAALLVASHDRPVFQRDRLTAVLALLAVVPFFTLYFDTLEESPGSAFLSDVRTAKVMVEGARYVAEERGSTMPGVATRSAVTAEPRGDRPNVLVFIGESLNREHMSAFNPDYPHDTTPQLKAFMQAHPDEFFPFERGFANSAGTRFAVMGILLGQYHGAPRDVLYDTPIAWQYAQKAGHKTLVVTTQSWDWANLVEFFVKNQPPDVLRHAGNMGSKIVNDTGIEDRVAAAAFVDALDTLEPGEPFFGVFQTNATHWPGLLDESVDWAPLAGDEIKEYASSVHVVDQANGMVLAALKERGLLENTIILHTADHGIPIGADSTQVAAILKAEPAMGSGVRLNSCEPQYTRVPTWMYVPKKWQTELGIQPDTLRANQSVVMSHTDLLPTIVDVLGYGDAQTGLPGSSLVRPLDADRQVYCFTTPSWSKSALTGIGVFDPDAHYYTRRDFDTLRVFDADDAAIYRDRHVGRLGDDDDWVRFKTLCERYPPALDAFEYLSEGR